MARCSGHLKQSYRKEHENIKRQITAINQDMDARQSSAKITALGSTTP